MLAIKWFTWVIISSKIPPACVLHYPMPIIWWVTELGLNKLNEVFDDDTNDASTTTRCCWRCKSRQRLCCHWQSCWLPPIVRHFGGYKKGTINALFVVAKGYSCEDVHSQLGRCAMIWLIVRGWNIAFSRRMREENALVEGFNIQGGGWVEMRATLLSNTEQRTWYY